ncbi:TonB-dependent receptor [Carboxylicivirga sediminis]|uniref:TonB-dependent receptor n=1 Tax=Carboxylicivirga sediminis TaxID=2006564 RepID=A0A941F4K3_9BACT|nr:TonB-dependent receptor [Carboxylicivirga sediminis]MBR8536332.1 TonB-dependent receptor [Carboxylicivirga sediminis]
MKKFLNLLFLILLSNIIIQAQKTDANIFGDVQAEGEHLPFVSVYLKDTQYGTMTDLSGHYMLTNLPEGEHILVASLMGYKPVEKKVNITKGQSQEINFILEEQVMSLDDIVITGTKTFKRKTESAVVVNVMEGKKLEMLQAGTLSEGLAFQPGLRMETDCQTCNYTQLRMNGLGGAYSQILINSRPVFSPLTGLYGLEQIPTNMIERIEVVRGGGSALYGAGAVGGTVNVITKVPESSSFSASTTQSVINGDANDSQVFANAGILSDRKNAGLTLFATNRNRESYDHNGDGFSELPKLKNNSFGFTSFLLPAPNHKLEASFSSMYEYRRGGDREDLPAFLAEQTEERTHNVLMGGLDYSFSFNDNLSSLDIYVAGQKTDRDHYTGIKPEADEPGYQEHLENPPYGLTENETYMGGVQLNHMLPDFLGGKNNLTFGSEYNYDMVVDEIKAYDYLLDQTTRNVGAYIQSDWELAKKWNLLTGVRTDKHNMVDKLIFSPRVSLLYKQNGMQLRGSWSTGFRAPQAFDSDMHIAFAGGGIQRIQLADDLEEERSQSWTASINYDKPTEKYIWGFTLEGFHTTLYDAFILEENGTDSQGNVILEKRNGSNSTVKGITLEGRANYNKLWQLEAGYTIQSSKYDEVVEWSESIEGTKDYLRTPEQYGYYTLTYNPVWGIKAALSGVYTGSMLVPHFGAGEGDETGNPINDELVKSDPFMETNIKLSYALDWRYVGVGLELFGGVQNLFNAYQDDFDKGKNRDSNYVYGPARPRTIYFGLKLMNL